MEIKNEEEFNNFINKDYALVDFYADWCGPCKMLSPIVESLATSRSNINVAKVNVDNNSEIARRYGVMSIPTLILFKNGVLQDKKVGFTPLELLNEWINDYR